jgi:transposase
MIVLTTGLRVYLGWDYRHAQGHDRVRMLVQQTLAEDPFGGTVFVFRRRHASLIKLNRHDGVGLCMLTRRLEQGQFVRPSESATGRSTPSSPQLAVLLGGCEWRAHAPPAALRRQAKSTVQAPQRSL